MQALLASGRCADPALSAAADLEGELYLREMRVALSVSDAGAAYDSEDYPAELRDFVLVRGYTLAEERYADYLARRAGPASERGAAVLDLRGLLGDFARNIALRDFSDYRSANDASAKIAAALAADEGP